MILDTLDHASAYAALGPRFAQAIAWLGRFDPTASDGRHDIQGDDVYALVQSYDTAPATTKKFESHRVFVDLQYVAAGSEIIHHAPAASLQASDAYKEKEDILLYENFPASTPLRMPAGTFAFFFPHDGHKPGCADGTVGRVKKVLVKIRA